MSIEKTSSGKWKVRYRSGGNSRSKTFDLRKDAEAFDLQIRRERQTRGLVMVETGKIKVRDFMARFYETQEHEWAPNTRNQYRQYIQAWINPMLGGYELRELTPMLLVEWKAELEKRGVGSPTVLKMMSLMSKMLNRAVLAGELQVNPLREVSRPKQSQKMAPAPLSPVEIETLRSLVGPKDKTILSILGYMGLRPVELKALCWEDVHQQTVMVRGDSKRDRERPGLLLPPVAQDLNTWKMESGSRTGLIFPGFDIRNWRKRVYHPAFNEAEIGGDNRPYRLRSSFVSLLLADPKYSIAEVALYAGHSLEIMSRHYANLIAEFQGRNIDAVAEIQNARLRRAA